MAQYTLLKEREVIAVTGRDSRVFLQGLISNDIDRINPSQSMYAAMLTAQGKYLHDFIMADRGPALWIDTEAERCDELTKRLSLFLLNSDVCITRKNESLTVAAVWGPDAAS